MSNAPAGKVIRRANPSTIHDKFLVGYQGWFTCAGDGEPVGPGHHGWLHWFNYPIPQGGRPNTDVWPDVSAYEQSELYQAPGLKKRNGDPVHLFSSRNATTVQRHFHWMAEHGVDGAFLQRFAGQVDIDLPANHGVKKIRDEVGDRVREAAEKEGRVWAIMYDISGVPVERLSRILERDWAHLVYEKRILDSPNYLREKGKPVIGLWGLGLDHFHHDTHVYQITRMLRQVTPGGSAYIFGGVPAFWRTGSLGSIPENVNCDASPHLSADVYLECFDAISPWTIGRYKTEKEVELWGEGRVKGDADCITKWNQERGERDGKKVDYIPVVLPGGSGFNLSEGKWGFNDIPRRGGRFLWQQIFNAKRVGVRSIYGAMWDEYDEGTALMPIVEHKYQLPQHDVYRFMALDEDGYDVPADWYMRICGFGSEALKSERRIYESFPSKELQDYWSSRPKYEDASSASGSGSGSGSGSTTAPVQGSSINPSAGQPPEKKKTGDGVTYEEWLASQKDEKEEAPPPPYTLEADEEGETPAQPPAQSAPPTRQTSQQTPHIPSSGPPITAAVAPVVTTTVTSPHQVSSPVAHSPQHSIAYGNNTYAPHTHNAVVGGYGGHAPGAPNVASPIGPGPGASSLSGASSVPPASGPGGIGTRPPATTYPPSTSTYPSQAPYSGSSSYPAQQPYGGASSTYPGQTSSTHPGQSSTYGAQTSTYPGQTSTYPGQVSSTHGAQPHQFVHSQGTGPQSSVHGHDPTVAALANDFGRQSIGGPSATIPHGISDPSSPPPSSYVPGAQTSSVSSPPPLHPAHLASSVPTGSGRPSRPSTSGGTVDQSYPPPRPSSQGRPQSSAGSRPQPVQGGYASTGLNQGGYPPFGSSATRPPAPTQTPSSVGQWPPQDWAVGGASNLSRPQTFTASSMYGGANNNGPPRPQTSLAASSAPGIPGGGPSSSLNLSQPSNSGPPRPSTTASYSASPPSMPSTSLPSTGYPGSGPVSYNNASSGYGSMGMPPYQTGGSSAPPSASTYPNMNSGWPGGGPHSSPPQSPLSFPPPVSSYGGRPPYGNAPSPNGPQFPGGVGVPMPGAGPPGHGTSPIGPQFPSGAGGALEPSESYFGIMPAPAPGGYSPYGGYNPSGGPSTNMPSPPGAWTPGGPALPPRPPTHSNSLTMPVAPSSNKPTTFPSGSGIGGTALGLALSTVDKVAGKKTREQLEGQIGSLAQSGTKLFNKWKS